jgi:hypothetical protein
MVCSFLFLKKYEILNLSFADLVNLLQFVFFTGGIVFLTLIVNGSTTQFLLHLLGLGKLSATKVSFTNYHLCFLSWG